MMKTPSHQVHTRYQVTGQTLVIDLEGRKRVLSSAPQGGGLTVASYILNHQVEANPLAVGKQLMPFREPGRCLRELASRMGVRAPTVGLMTAVPMTQVVTARAASDGLWVECFATVGVTNAVRAGDWPPGDGAGNRLLKPGTINLILITNGSLSQSAMVGAVQVVTEAKSGVLRDHGVLSCQSSAAATGTGTDAVVIACSLRGQGAWHIYSGTHTVMGALIGQVVTDCVTHGLAKARAWQESHQ
ncbi:MAG: adenosylcobinamide amidohydrolase [Nitrospira sp.]|nr:adenosylcobinamide amidohydrolase [Nitrospira sp.]